MASLGSYEKHSQSEIHLLNLDKYKHNFNLYTEKPIVLLTIFEHNANLIPWRESGANVIIIPMTKNGDLDYDYLSQQLNIYKNWNSLKVGAFVSGSNVTGNLFNTDYIAAMCHKAGFLACFDYAATCPY